VKLHEAIRHYREAKGWTRAELAKELGIHRTQVYRMEKPDCNFRFRLLLRLDEIFTMGLHFVDINSPCDRNHRCEKLEL